MKHMDGHIDLFAYHDQDEIGLWRADHTIQELRIASPTIRPSTIAIELNGTPYIPIHDLTGHIVTLLDLEGNTIESYRYSVFGEREIFEGNDEDTPRSTSAIGNPWQYSEKRYDEESGLLAFGLRYYDPKLGRWISQDPAEFEDGPNRYAYVHNNPLILFDRYGLFSEFGYNGLDWYSPSPPLDYRTFDILTPMSQAGLSFAWDALNNPYVYGSMQTIGGLTEASVGAGMALYSSGLAAPLGWPIMAHGVDHYVAGMNTLFSGVPKQTATSHLLQQTGIPPQSSNLIDNGIGIVATMGGAALLRTTTPPVVSYRGIISPPPKPPSGLGNTTAQIATEIDGFFKPFTKQYYRENLIRLTGYSPPKGTMHAHHVFPQKYIDRFLAKNINIHDPKYLTWWEATSHRKNAVQYNLKWEKFFEKFRNPTTNDILEYGKQLMSEHKTQTNY
jgi:RHS repeat-associated protein